MADTEKTLKTRILLSYDSEDAWKEVETFTPKAGEVIVVADNKSKAPKYFIVGDGQTLFVPEEGEPTLPKFYPFNPEEVNLSNYYTMAQTDTAIENAIDAAIYKVLNTAV